MGLGDARWARSGCVVCYGLIVKGEGDESTAKVAYFRTCIIGVGAPLCAPTGLPKDSFDARQELARLANTTRPRQGPFASAASPSRGGDRRSGWSVHRVENRDDLFELLRIVKHAAGGAEAFFEVDAAVLADVFGG